MKQLFDLLGVASVRIFDLESESEFEIESSFRVSDSVFEIASEAISRAVERRIYLPVSQLILFTDDAPMLCVRVEDDLADADLGEDLRFFPVRLLSI